MSMTQGKYKTVAILGGGPVGSALAAYLAKGGVKTVIFTHKNRPELLIGESLIPAVVTLLRDLGVEDEVRSYSTFKPGATFLMRANDEISFYFNRLRNSVCTYAYNTPRDQFDKTLLDNAVRNGTHLVLNPVKPVALPDGSVALDPDSEAQFAQLTGSSPDLIVDATGRARTIAKLLGINAKEGPRKDRALFAHLEGVNVQFPGNIHVDRLTRGWSWRIPLPGRVSVGFVVPEEHAEKYGATALEQFEGLLAQEPAARRFAPAPKRLTTVMKYHNYQLISDRHYGKNWVLAGDAGGFVDPVFSSGLLIGLTSAQRLSREILSSRPNFAAYQRNVQSQLRSWQNVVRYFYDGRLFGLLRIGRLLGGQFPTSYIGPFVERHLGRILTGTAPEDPVSQGIMSLTMTLALGGGHGLRLKVA